MPEHKILFVSLPDLIKAIVKFSNHIRHTPYQSDIYVGMYKDFEFEVDYENYGGGVYEATIVYKDVETFYTNRYEVASYYIF